MHAGDHVAGMHNLTSYSLGWMWQGEKHGVKAEVFQFMASEDGGDSGDEAYVDLGSGSGLPGDFDYIPLDGEGDLGQEVDLIYNYTVNEYFGFEAGLAYFMPGDAVDELLDNYNGSSSDEITRIWGQARLRF